MKPHVSETESEDKTSTVNCDDEAQGLDGQKCQKKSPLVGRNGLKC
jgi:hypothetical protein